MSGIDWLVIGLYLLAVTGLGLWTAERVRDPHDFFMGGRRFGKLFMVCFGFGAGTHTDQAVSVAARTYSHGLSGIWLQWIWLFVTPFFWLFAPIFRRMRALTTADYFELRYSRSVAALYALVGALQLTVNIGTMIKGVGTMLVTVSGGSIHEGTAIATLSLLFTVYGIAGGLQAAIVIDLVQSVLTIGLSFMLLPFALRSVGGFTGLRIAIGEPEAFHLIGPGDMFYIVVVGFNALVGVVTQPHVHANCAAGKTELDGCIGYTYGNLIKRVCTIGWALTGLTAIALYPGLTTPAEIDQTFGLMARDLLPAVGPGLIGLFIACILAAVMSSCDAWMLSSAALVTENIYRPYFAPDRSRAHYLRVGRIVAGTVVLSSVIYAHFLESVSHGLETFWRVQALMGIAFWVGLFWRRATATAAWCSTLVAFAVAALGANALRNVFDVNAFAQHWLPAWTLQDGALRLPVQMLAYLGTGFVTIVAVSLLTPRPSQVRLDRLYRALHTPVGQDEPPPRAPFEVPPESIPRPRRKIIEHPDFELRYPTVGRLLGFLHVWLWVLALFIGLAWFIAGAGHTS